MKKIIVMSLLGGTLLIACSKKVVPSTDTGATNKTPAEKASTEKVSTDKTTEEKKTADASDTAPVSTNPVEGVSKDVLIANGKAVYQAKCTRCHAYKNPGDYTTDKWDAILKSMIPKAKLDPTEQHEVLAYVRDNAKK